MKVRTDETHTVTMTTREAVSLAHDLIRAATMHDREPAHPGTIGLVQIRIGGSDVRVLLDSIMFGPAEMAAPL